MSSSHEGVGQIVMFAGRTSGSRSDILEDLGTVPQPNFQGFQSEATALCVRTKNLESWTGSPPWFEGGVSASSCISSGHVVHCTISLRTILADAVRTPSDLAA